MNKIYPISDLRIHCDGIKEGLLQLRNSQREPNICSEKCFQERRNVISLSIPSPTSSVIFPLLENLLIVLVSKRFSASFIFFLLQKIQTSISCEFNCFNIIYTSFQIESVKNNMFT
jgi:hypothetical protein